MPDAPATVNVQRQGEQAEESPIKKIWAVAQQFLLMWVVMQVATKYFAKTPPQQAVVPTPHGHAAEADGPVTSGFLTQAVLGWPLGTPVSMHVHLSTSPWGDVFSPQQSSDALPSWIWSDITFGDWNEARIVDIDVKIPQSVQNNGSLWADIFLAKGAASPNPYSPNFDPTSIHHIRKLLTYYMPKLKSRKEKNLLSGSTDENIEHEELVIEADEIISHWHQNLTLGLVSDHFVLDLTKMPAPVAEHVHLIPGVTDETGTKALFQPVIFPNEFWNLRSQFTEINSTTPNLPLRVVFQPMSYFKFQLFASMTVGFKDAAKQQGGGASAELDEVKRMLVETNPFLLGLTAVVTVLHMVFEILAFKNDVSHWRQKSEMIGVSVRTIVLNVFVQTVILLYLIDNNEQTSWMILFSSGMGVLIEAWKITKAVDTVFIPAPGSLLRYRVEFRDKHVLSEDEKKTQEYDKLAFRYVSYVTIPLLAAYTGYSLFYETHRGWYSFTISTLTSFVYMFGFAQLIPQLIINYKLKSVAHMPMKAMIYKTLSTVVDDFFAFCIKMPILHRLACFRDDVVFLIFLYQRWIYRIDPKRINEYGQIMAADADALSSEARKGSVAEKNKETKKDK